jgi:hypothetical protein
MTASFLANLQRAHAAPPAAAAAHARFAGDHRLLALRNRLFADAAPLMERGMRLHVLVDPVLVDPLEDAPGRQQAVPLPLTGRHDDRTRHPYLLALGDIGRDEIIDRALDLDWAEATRHVERETRGSTVCALLACEPEHTAEVARSLAEFSRRRAASRQQPFLRLWDPRVAELLMPLLSATASRELTGGAAAWWTLDRRGELVGHFAIDGAARTDGDRVWQSPAVVDILASAGAINGVLNALQDAGVAPSRFPSTSTLLALIARARSQWGLADDFDLIQFALHGVLVRADFDADPDVRAAMSQARARGDSCIEALNSFDESHWEQGRHV